MKPSEAFNQTGKRESRKKPDKREAKDEKRNA
jgi:hypothetical protein